MQYCSNCRVDIAGNKKCCPMCGNHLDGVGDSRTEVFPAAQSRKTSKTVFLRALALALISSTIICALINMAVTPQIWWSLFVAAGAACIFITAAAGVACRKDFFQTVKWQVLLLIALSFLWDIFTGWQGWSVDFALPCACFAGIVLMLIYCLLTRSAFQAFAGPFIFVCIVGIVPGILALFGKVHVLFPSLICTGVAAILLSAILLFRWKLLRREFIRRFHL